MKKYSKICECIYDVIWGFVNGYAAVKKNGKRGFINGKGEEICNCIYDAFGWFNDGFLTLKKYGAGKRNGIWYSIDENGIEGDI